VEKQFWQFKLIENTNYFDFKYNNFSNINAFIVNVDQYIFYCNIFVFVNSLKNLVKLVNYVIRIEELIFSYLCKNVFVWYSIKLNEFTKSIFCNAILKQ